jgi:hypothetical protein
MLQVTHKPAFIGFRVLLRAKTRTGRRGLLKVPRDEASFLFCAPVPRLKSRVLRGEKTKTGEEK